MRTFKQFIYEGAGVHDTWSTDGASKEDGRLAICHVVGISPETFEKMRPYIGKKATVGNIMKLYNAFVDAFPKEARGISTNRGPQVGPGEMIFYFVFDNIGVGGNQNIDLFVDGKPFAEVKAGDVITRSGERCVEKFELSPGSHPAVRKIIKAFKDFNEAYKDDHDGDDLPGWKSEDHINISPLIKWRDLTLSGAGGLDLTLKNSGDLLRKGEEDPLLNVKKDKTLSPLKKLLDEPTKGSSINDAIEDWAKSIGDTYVKDKLFCLIDNAKMKCIFVGAVTSDNLDLMAIWRGRPIARVYPSGKPKGTKEETE